MILKGFRDITDGIATMANGFNPMVTNIEGDRNKEIAAGLLASGFTEEDILNFVNVDVAQLTKYLELEAEVQKRLAEATKTPVKEQTKAEA